MTNQDPLEAALAEAGADQPDAEAEEATATNGRGLPPRANITTLAAHVGLPRDKAARILKAAGLRRVKGVYLSDKALDALRASLDPAHVLSNAINGRASADAAAPGLSSYAATRELGERLKNQRLQNALDVQQGKLVSRSAVIQLTTDIATRLRMEILSVAPKIAADLVGKDAEAIQSLLSDALSAALTTLSDDILIPSATDA